MCNATPSTEADTKDSDSSGSDDKNTFRCNQRVKNYHSTFYVHGMHLYMRLYLFECRGVFECGGEA